MVELQDIFYHRIYRVSIKIQKKNNKKIGEKCLHFLQFWT